MREKEFHLPCSDLGVGIFNKPVSCKGLRTGHQTPAAPQRLSSARWRAVATGVTLSLGAHQYEGKDRGHRWGKMAKATTKGASCG